MEGVSVCKRICGDHVSHDGVVDQLEEGHGLPLRELRGCELGQGELFLGELLKDQIGRRWCGMMAMVVVYGVAGQWYGRCGRVRWERIEVRLVCWWVPRWGCLRRYGPVHRWWPRWWLVVCWRARSRRGPHGCCGRGHLLMWMPWVWSYCGVGEVDMIVHRWG